MATIKERRAVKRAKRAAFWKLNPSKHVNHPARRNRRSRLLVKHLREHGVSATAMVQHPQPSTVEEAK
jgi:hypothetical protein